MYSNSLKAMTRRGTITYPATLTTMNNGTRTFTCYVTLSKAIDFGIEASCVGTSTRSIAFSSEIALATH